MSLIDQAKKHFSEKVSMSSMHAVEIPEWGETNDDGELVPARVYVRPETTSDRAKYIKQILENDPSGFVDLLITRCRREAGTKAFTNADRNVLLNEVDPKVITRIATEILTWDSEVSTGDDPKKN